MVTKKEKNIILLLALIILAGAGWSLFKKLVVKCEAVTSADTEMKECFDRENEQADELIITADDPVNINTDGLERIEALPYIGRQRAEDIIKFREENGPFTHLEDLSNVKGIGLKTIDKLKILIRL